MSLPAANEVPDIVVSRLPLYLRALGALRAAGQQFTSSHELARALGLSSAQIRKDLSHFGEFGKQGTGYPVQRLIEQLRDILKLDHEWPVIVIGAGHIGSAVANYPGFAQRGFRVVAVFDANPRQTGQHVGAHSVRGMGELADVVKQQHVHHAMIAVPSEAAQSVADVIIAVGIRAILNYAPVMLITPPHVHVEYIDPVLHLQRMTFYL